MNLSLFDVVMFALVIIVSIGVAIALVVQTGNLIAYLQKPDVQLGLCLIGGIVLVVRYFKRSTAS